MEGAEKAPALKAYAKLAPVDRTWFVIDKETSELVLNGATRKKIKIKKIPRRKNYMTVKVGINGFGRIGRLAFRRIQDVEGLEVVAINDLTDAKQLAHLLKYDSTQGRFNGEVEVLDGAFRVNGKEVKVLANRNPEELPWGELGVDIVLECTGFFTSKEKS